MSQIYIIAGMLGLISVLVCVVFIRQTIVKKRKEKERLARALLKKVAYIQQMLECFPQGFLTTDLSVLLLRNIADAYETLIQLQPENKEYADHYTLYSTALEEAIKTNTEGEDALAFDSSVQINELKQSLNQLGRFLQNWGKQGTITAKQFGLYKAQIKRLATQMVVDNYMIAANQSAQSKKLKLAIHYYTLAKNLVTEEGLGTTKRKQLMIIAEKLPKLKEALEEENRQREADSAAKTQGQAKSSEQAQDQTENSDSGQWAELNEDDSWKKKNVYD